MHRCESDFDWLKSIDYNSNAIAAIKQIHNFNQNAIYFKYVNRKDKQY